MRCFCPAQTAPTSQFWLDGTDWGALRASVKGMAVPFQGSANTALCNEPGSMGTQAWHAAILESAPSIYLGILGSPRLSAWAESVTA